MSTAKRDYIKVRGTYHIQILDPEGHVVGDSGKVHNQVTNLGFQDYLCALLGNTTGSKQVSFIALGTSGAPAAADTTLGGEVVKRKAATVAVSSTSKTVRFTATFGSSDSFVTNTQNLSNIGLFHTSSGGTLGFGAALTAGSSSCATNQQVNATYDITFA